MDKLMDYADAPPNDSFAMMTDMEDKMLLNVGSQGALAMGALAPADGC